MCLGSADAVFGAWRDPELWEMVSCGGRHTAFKEQLVSFASRLNVFKRMGSLSCKTLAGYMGLTDMFVAVWDPAG